MSSANPEELVRALVLREMKDGVRRDGLWSQALSESGMDTKKATARYIELRVQTLKDEMREVMIRQIKSAVSQDNRPFFNPARTKPR